MSNVFITGFERSGTTLVRRLVSMWPGYDKDVLHETRKLLTYKTAQEAENNYNDEYSSIKSGEKLPYYNNVDQVISYIRKFREFWQDSIIFHVMRHPDDVCASCKRTFKRPESQTVAVYAESVPAMVNYLLEEPNVVTIEFDNLMKNPSGWVRAIYEKLGFVPDDKILDKIMNTKEEWELDGKRYCGLRYNNKIARINH